jgi:hypothetical protein
MHRQSRPEYLRNVRTEPLSTLHKFYAIPSRWMARIQTSVVPWSGLRTPSFVKASCSLCMHLSPLQQKTDTSPWCWRLVLIVAVCTQWGS